MTVKHDTGHAFGLLRAMVHADGHVVNVAGSAAGIPALEATLKLFAEIGIAGSLRLEWLPPEVAVTRHLASIGCEVCRVKVSCGCDVVQDVLAGTCPHGTRKAIQAAARRSGYLDAMPKPGTQAELDDWATNLVAVDAAIGHRPRRPRDGGPRER